ncbi:hypothetical protein [Asticcacaulis sp.]|uniref:hypothetical protein n=1 Tax=Asticcacaulis sp. TaxID=1872648 RepID=UPI00260F8A0D|nr:hypothetical protein [Asticcacaulis sp.]
MKLKQMLAGALAFAVVSGSGLPTQAAPTQKYLEILARALSFAIDGPAGEIETAIVYVPGNAASEAEKAELVALLGNGLQIGKVVLKGKAVPATDADAAKAKLWLVTSGAGAKATPLAGSKVFTASTEKGCAEAAQCVLAIETEPKVQIYVSRKAADVTGVSFQNSFLVMVKEL